VAGIEGEMLHSALDAPCPTDYRTGSPSTFRRNSRSAETAARMRPSDAAVRRCNTAPCALARGVHRRPLWLVLGSDVVDGADRRASRPRSSATRSHRIGPRRGPRRPGPEHAARSAGSPTICSCWLTAVRAGRARSGGTTSTWINWSQHARARTPDPLSGPPSGEPGGRGYRRER